MSDMETTRPDFSLRVLRALDGRLLVETADGVVPVADAWRIAGLPDAPPADAGEWIRRDRFRAEVLEALVAAWTGAGRALGPVPAVLAPPLRPGKILALGRNYAEHAREMGSAPALPFFFAKLPSCCVGHGEAIVIPEDLEGDVHHEVELGVVIGRPGRRIGVAAAAGHVAAYAVLNDVTARTLQAKAKEKGHPWTAAKNLDTFCPLGPGIVPAERVPDPGALRIRLLVDGEVRQTGSTGDMILPVPQILAHLSRHLTLETGDLIATGTPAGVGALRPGQTVRCEIEGVGILENPVRAG